LVRLELIVQTPVRLILLTQELFVQVAVFRLQVQAEEQVVLY
jgi:hypothetical protein